MEMTTDDTATLLDRSSKGDFAAGEEFAELVYDELRALAERAMRSERLAHTLQPTAVVHEAYIRMFGGRAIDWQSRTHFLAVGAEAVRRVLVDHARRRQALKRDGGGVSMTVCEPAVDENADSPAEPFDLLALDRAMGELGELNERHRRVVELRFFGGLSNREIAEVLHVSRGTVKADWRTARAWLRRRIDPGGHADGGGPRT